MIVARQITANASTSTFLSTIPNGVASIVITNGGSTAVLVGPGSNLTQSNGLVIPPNTCICFETYAGSKGSDMSALVATGGSTQPVSILISTTD